MIYEDWDDYDDCDPFERAREDGWIDPTDQTKALIDVMNERDRQRNEEGWTLDGDDAHFPGKLAQAASCYARNAGSPLWGSPPTGWPLDRSWWKPTTPRRDLVKAAALILAEIERLDRAAAAMS